MRIRTASLVLAAAVCACPALAQEWKVLSDEAIALYQKGDLAGAEAKAAKSLEVATAAVGPESPIVATRLNNLAVVYRAQKKYAEAEPLYLRALAIREKALGPNHAEVAVTLNNLAALHDAQDHFVEAEDLYKRSLAIREKTLGRDHLETAASLNSLAELYMVQRKYERAEPLLERAYEIRKKLGEKDPDRLATQRDLWTLYVSTERYALAEEYQPEGAMTPNEAQMRRRNSKIPSPKGFDPTVR